MVSALWTFIIAHEWIWVLLFYVILAIVIFLNRKKFQVEAKFILMYKTKWGIKFINKFADKNKEFVKLVGYSAIGIGFLGMIAIVGFFIKGLYELIFVPSALPTMSLVIPGVQIPGSPIFVPFWYGIIALFCVVVFHEFGHGIIARAHGIKIQSTGIVFFGPIIGAFVEPDEKQLTKQSSHVQHSVFAAGPFFNALLAAAVLLVLLLIFNPLLSTMVDPTGVTFTSLQKGYPAETYGLEKGVTYTQVNGVPIKDSTTLVSELSCVKPNQTVTFVNSEKNVTMITTASPDDKTKGYIGVTGIKTNYVLKSEAWWYKGVYYLLFILTNLLEWIFMLSLGIGLANLLPLGPVDGGRMLHIGLTDIQGKEKGYKTWVRVSIITLVVLLILVLVPIIKSVLFKM
ncbi:MAG: site-2 protease family protein [Candidatus Woesearchaeota archaeon]